MINETEHLLICVAEECAEVQHRVTKALRFGLDEVQPGQLDTNADRIVAEIGDLLGVLELLTDKLPRLKDPSGSAIAAKQAKVRKFMDYARSIGTLESASEISDPGFEIESVDVRADRLVKLPVSSFGATLSAISEVPLLQKAQQLAEERRLNGRAEMIHVRLGKLGPEVAAHA